MRNVPAIWRTVEPNKWPPVPTWMTFSKLKEIETCPRRWALQLADYPEIWDRHGYPEKPQIVLILGRIVHRALEERLNALSRASCLSVQDPGAIPY